MENQEVIESINKISNSYDKILDIEVENAERVVEIFQNINIEKDLNDKQKAIIIRAFAKSNNKNYLAFDEDLMRIKVRDDGEYEEDNYDYIYNYEMNIAFLAIILNQENPIEALYEKLMIGYKKYYKNDEVSKITIESAGILSEIQKYFPYIEIPIDLHYNVASNTEKEHFNTIIKPKIEHVAKIMDFSKKGEIECQISLSDFD